MYLKSALQTTHLWLGRSALTISIQAQPRFTAEHWNLLDNVRTDKANLPVRPAVTDGSGVGGSPE